MVFKLYRLLSHPSVSCLPTKFECQSDDDGHNALRRNHNSDSDGNTQHKTTRPNRDGLDPWIRTFSSYEQEFNDLVISIRNALNVEAKNSVGEQRKAVLRRVERDYEEAEEILSQMDVELHSLDRALKPTISQKLKSYKAELSGFKSQIKQAYSQANPTDLNSDSPYQEESDLSNSTKERQAQRERLLRSQQVLESSSNRLDSSHRIALETEELGSGILRDLRGQREQIENTRDTVEYIFLYYRLFHRI
ncbi:hypothetical protein Pst134EA_000448 [Puccinia striiformis f. sp. tritici]|uniref:hypothetical protein n=1 Tax=Puccinia striiformis f. sp. tritici TaxID=168172 RepID=UPI00200810ED|nr:hypothetical protein Pst134EA_000448 [Puccinia striiformis f. sp. tritici]KAH9473375.1 hypothetical protein Pst134EA_000448 [Puccinia striiformis f. sp. tritici]